ncbi:MAG: hypothetical protein SFW67_31265 [Myxococcaceae bacterium]|nr:hypothetical protein [Myxococcaceae bacterium]
MPSRVLLVVLVGLGCGGREQVVSTAAARAADAGERPDGGAIDGGRPLDAGAESAADGSIAHDGGLGDGGAFDIFAFVPDAGVGARCNACLVANGCGLTINACVNAPVCTVGLSCTVVDCFLAAPADGGLIRRGDAGVDQFTCALTCFKGDFVATLQALGATACAVGCAGVCTGDFLSPILGAPDAGRPDAGR